MDCQICLRQLEGSEPIYRMLDIFHIFLAKPRHSIHTRWHEQTVPVNTRVFRKPVCYVNAQPIPLHSLNGWTMNLAIEPPAMSAKSWREFVINLSGDQMNNFHAFDNLIRERRPIRSDDWGVVLSGFTRRELLCCISLVIAGAFGCLLLRRICRFVSPSRGH